MEECPVCYCNNATCKLVCNHSFCKGCVKTWYFKSEEPSCPMCRRDMYFKGMHRVVRDWEDERILKKNEDAFDKAFDEIFEETAEFDDSSSYEGSDSDSSWESWDEELDEELDEEDAHGTRPSTPEIREERHAEGSLHSEDNFFCLQSRSELYSEFILGEIMNLQKDYQKSIELGVDFEWYMENVYFFDIEPSDSVIIEDDVFPHFKNLFVSNHKNVIQNKRMGKRNYANTDTMFTIVIDLVF